ncbi:DUF4190 domain-containing protein [Flavobacterium sp. SM15]|uniref:CCC motif membrane protein n=1 Tax=Flavobacterium sp. SM15 TaxID=2908005 RepID=UPI001EDA6B20|nr:CCC motif membrane protein [Flavobacterium sp. SM15]MCG2611924.1 DUF4190 domain-containing protein [Flavobacterium sp. SM15]
MEKQKLPNGTAVIILGIMSIITCCCYGVLSFILGGIGLYLANKDTKEYNENPELYSNFNNVKTGKILCIIGIVLGVIFLLIMAWYINLVGWDALQDPELLEQRMKEITEQ